MGIASMLGQNVGRVGRARDIMKLENRRGYGLTNTMKRQHRVSLVEFRVGNRQTIDHGLVVTE